ncbi:hypothetical protein Pcinc_036775 [Petrolisthes cinctipes]|uniref:Uncharacterized protein n=1 Tax=Petrolisthes cinctipes TaxID=88211 RepID=A0AAE1BUZ1_PETCI|nr:hypothetical protein Pcinc_036775 [Petrolisthes cinctipes]
MTTGKDRNSDDDKSPLYESLVSIFTESEDTITIPDTDAEHEYQQIQPSQCRRGGPEGQQEVRKGGHEGQQEGRRGGNERQQQGGNSREEEEEKQQQQSQQKMKVRKVNTLDVKPEKQCSNGELGSGDEALCTCQNGVSPNSLWDTLPSHHRGQPSGSSSHSASSQDNSHSNKSAIYITTTSDSEMTDSDIYLAASLAPTVIHVSKPDRISTLQHIANSSDSNGKGSSGKQTSGFFSASNSQSTREKRFSRSSSSSSSGTTNNSKSPYSARNGSDEQVSSSSSSSRERAQVKARTKPPPDPVYPPLTIELPETKTPAWRPEQPPRTTKNKSTQVSLNSTSSPHIITTLDPPLKPGRLQPRFSHDSTTSKTSATSVVSSRDVPTTLVVNFDSENSDNDEATSPESDSDSCSSTLAGSTSIYLTDGDTSSIYSSVAEIYSVLTSDTESLVYVYRPQPRRSRHRYSTLSYRFPNYTLDR